MPLTPGEKLGPYEIVAPIGGGGKSDVYEARDTRLGRSFAVKVLPSHITGSDDLRARFEREARVFATLKHPNICTLHDIGPGYLVMELIEGETLAARIVYGPLPLDQTLRAAFEIADALDCAHRFRFIHGGLNPGNIMLTRNTPPGGVVEAPLLADNTLTVEEIKLINFALVRSRPMSEGAAHYLAPEQLEGREADVRADIWAFGAVLYEMITGRQAFQGEDNAGVIRAILSGEPDPIEPAWLNRVVMRCLKKDAGDRWQSMRDILRELRAPQLIVTPPAPDWDNLKWIAAGAGIAKLAADLLHYVSTTGS